MEVVKWWVQAASNGSDAMTPRVTERRKPGLVSSSGNITSEASLRAASRVRQCLRMSLLRGPRPSLLPERYRARRWQTSYRPTPLVISGRQPFDARS